MPRARKTALTIFQDYGEQVPVDVESIARDQGISVRQEELESSTSGVLVIKVDGSVIVVNSSHHPSQRRFTIAHQLGHYLLHRHTAKVFFDEALICFRAKDTPKGKPLEHEATTFALELLIPESAIQGRLLAGPLDAFDEPKLSTLAGEFQVPPPALTIRLTSLGMAVPTP